MRPLSPVSAPLSGPTVVAPKSGSAWLLCGPAYLSVTCRMKSVLCHNISGSDLFHFPILILFSPCAGPCAHTHTHTPFNHSEPLIVLQIHCSSCSLGPYHVSPTSHMTNSDTFSRTSAPNYFVFILNSVFNYLH